MIMKVVTIHTKVSIRATCCSPGWTMILYTHRRCLEVTQTGPSESVVTLDRGPRLEDHVTLSELGRIDEAF
jgi:hypothetical protein